MKSATWRKNMAVGAVVAAAAMVSAGCGSAHGALAGSGSSGAAKGSPIVIGQEICQTGYLAATDLYLAKGAGIAVDQINKAGGILHHKVELQTKDTQCVASSEIQLAEQFIEQSHASAIIGGFQSAAISGVLPIVKQAKVPFVGAGTLPSRAVWGVTTFPPNTYPGQAFLNYFVSKFHVKSIGNIAGATPYGAAVQTAVTSEAKAAGVTTKNAEISNTATSATPVLQQLSGTDAIFANTSGPINIIMAKDATNLGLKIPMIFNDPADCLRIAAAYQPTYCEILQPMEYQNVGNPVIKANDAALWHVFKASGGKIVNFSAVAVGADQIRLIAKAMTAAGTTEGSAVSEALSRLSYVGAQAEYKFQPGSTFGMSANPYILTSVDGNGMAVVYQAAGS